MAATIDGVSGTDAPMDYPQMLGHPRPLWLLFMTEFWERFCYYGIRWALTLYIVAAFFGGDPSGQASASRTYGAYTALVYATGVIGGYVADRYLGFQRSVLLGGVIISIGLFTTMVPNHSVFLLGLAIIIVGNGLFKPNISTMVGGLYATSDARRDRGFTIFYMGINAGAFFAPLITGWAANAMFGGTPEHPNYSAVFLASGIGMLIGVLWFMFGRRQLGPVGKAPPGREGFGSVLGVIVGGAIALPILYFLLNNYKLDDVTAHIGFNLGTGVDLLDVILWAVFLGCCFMLVMAGVRSDRVQLDKIVAMLILFAANILFWMFFEQAGSSFNFLAEQVVDRKMFGGWEFPIGWFQSVNPLAIVLLGPVISGIWLFLDRRGKEPSIPRKFGLGLIGNALGFLVLMWALTAMVGTDNLIPFWPLAACYVLQTMGELSISPIGLSMVTKLAPAYMVGATMGAWFMSISLGNKLAGNLAAHISGETGITVASALKGFTFSFYLLAGVGVLLFLIAPLINKLMHGVR